ncbi:MAG: DUF4105 domain-containing protein [Longimicrobiales bacterium]
MKSRRRAFVLALAAIPVVAMAAFAFVRPSNNRTWEVGQDSLPVAQFDGSRVTIRHFRNFRYDSAAQPIPSYDIRTFDLERINTVWLVIAPFERDNRGPAHSFLSFGFADSQYVAVSVEARREQGESYSLLKGMLRRFEILYIMGDERDLIGLRTNHRGDDVYVYPIRTTPAQVRRLFVDILNSANTLQKKPEFYNTLTNNCTTRILQHANQVAARKIPWGREVLLPGYADELALRLGLLDATGSIEEVRARYLVNQRARAYANSSDFSTRIRSAPTPAP